MRRGGTRDLGFAVRVMAIVVRRRQGPPDRRHTERTRSGRRRQSPHPDQLYQAAERSIKEEALIGAEDSGTGWGGDSAQRMANWELDRSRESSEEVEIS